VPIIKFVKQNFLLSPIPPRYWKNIREMWFIGMSRHKNTAKAELLRKLKKSPSKCHPNLSLLQNATPI
jgi:hypothetical protein